ncbi:hypothetical protein MIR68_008300 [Amoeboaphelidium protococcarum]|nr:hypothetical protein MIR68_008300 [Amoeboaphelidium protococcarum]
MKVKQQVDIHPAMMKLGLQFKHYKIMGSNQRALALIQALREVIADYTTPPNDLLSRNLDAYLKHQINYVIACRPNSISTGAVIRYIKLEISSIAPDMPENDAKLYLDEQLIQYANDRIFVADQAIIDFAMRKIKDGDVIVTYAFSTVVYKTLVKARRDGVRFSVVCVDSRPLFEGRKMMEHLMQQGIDCSYTQLSGFHLLMSGSATKVIIGAHGMLSNGALMSRSGTSLVCTIAQQAAIPVVVLCEGYKFSDRVQMEGYLQNEMGDPSLITDIQKNYNASVQVSAHGTIIKDPTATGNDSKGGNSSQAQNTKTQSTPQSQPGSGRARRESNVHLSKSSVLMQSQHASNNVELHQLKNLKVLFPLHDITPASHISIVITETGSIPSSAVPVVIREQQRMNPYQNLTK